MNLRNTYILFAAVIVVLVVFVVVLTYGPRGDADEFLFPDLRGKAKGDELTEVKKSIDKVEIERLSPPADTLLFAREGTGWVLKKPYPAHVDAAAVDRLIGALVDAKVDTKTAPPAKAQAGLDPPGAAVTLMKGDKSYRVMLGQLTLGSNSRVYAAAGNRPDKVLTLSRTAIEELLRPGGESAGSVGEAIRGVSDFRPANLLADGSPIPWDVVQQIVLEAGSGAIVLKKDDLGGWTFLKPDNYGPADAEGDPSGPATQSIAGVKPLLTRLAGLRLPSAADDLIEGADNLAAYGLAPGKESMRIQLQRRDGGTETLMLGAQVPGPNDKVYATLANERLVMKLPSAPFDQIRKLVESPKALRDRTLLTLVPHTVDAIDITLAGEKKFELRRLGTPAQWRLFEGGDAYENSSQRAVDDLLNALTTRRNIRDFPDSAAGDQAYGLDHPAVKIDLWVLGIVSPAPPKDAKPEEKKETPITRPTMKGEPTIQLAFGKKDKDIVYVKRIMGIVSNLVALPEGTLTSAARPLTDYLDLTLPSFDRAKVTRLTFNRGAVKYDLEKPGGDPAAAAWNILQPPDIAGRAANADRLDQILNALVGLQAARVLARKATDAELERYGLKPPRIEATVALKDVKDPKVYQFGGESDDKQHYYARLGGSERVYLVEKTRVEPVLTGEIADPTIWRLDAARISSIKLTGWKSLTGGMPLTLELLRKSPTEWSVKDQADYTVDALKAEKLASELFLIRTDRFVKSKGGPGPEHKLDLKDDALIVEVTVTGQKEPSILTVGAEVKENNTDYYYASSNRMPGAVFLVFKERFADIRKSGRGYFQKAK